MIVATPRRVDPNNRNNEVAKGGPLVRTDAIPPPRVPSPGSRPKVANSIDRGTSKLHAIRLHHPLYPLCAVGRRTGFNIEENYVIGSRYALVAEGEN